MCSKVPGLCTGVGTVFREPTAVYECNFYRWRRVATTLLVLQGQKLVFLFFIICLNSPPPCLIEN